MFTLSLCLRTDWFPWSKWGECSTYTTCGRGYKLRTRKCGNGGTAGVDRLCKGPTNETAPCKVPGCEGEYLFLSLSYYVFVELVLSYSLHSVFKPLRLFTGHQLVQLRSI